MVFKCQEDSFLTEYESKVVSCDKAEFTTIVDGKQVKIDGYEVICEDTVLFPEGGGQPSDAGYLDDQPVYQVLRRADKAIHLVKQPFEVGRNVKQKIDWERRFDHMQQHSGQHLITAILEREFRYVTVSWYLGEDDAYIELDTSSIKQDEITKTELICNQIIRDHVNVTVQVFNENTPETELENFRSARGLPADHKGDIRVVSINGIDSNMCCGTHITNTSQLQVVKLLHWEKSKRKNQILLHFLVGNRVINKLGQCIEREQKLNLLLKTNPSQHVEFVEKMSQNIKTLNKNLQNVLKDLAIHEAKQLKDSTVKYFSLHRKEADPDFMQTFIRELNRTDIFLFLSVGDEKNDGNILLYGDETAIADLGNKICEVLGGKGAGKGNRFQAKVTKMSKRKEVEKLIQDYFN